MANSASVVISGPGPQRTAARGHIQLAPTTSRHPSHRRLHPADPGTGARTGLSVIVADLWPIICCTTLISAPDVIASEDAV